MIAALLAVVTIGFGEGPAGPTTFYWQIESEDGTLREYATSDWKLTFAPKPYWRWRARSMRSGGVWSDWSPFHEVKTYLGDSNGDTQVDVLDFKLLLDHFGETAP